MTPAERQKAYRERKKAKGVISPVGEAHNEVTPEPLQAVVLPGPERPLAKGPLLRLVEALHESRQISTPVRRRLIEAIRAA